MNLKNIFCTYQIIYQFSIPQILTGSIDKTVKIWDLISSKLVSTIYKQAPIRNVKISNGKQNLISANDIELIDIKIDKTRSVRYQSNFSATSLSDCGKVLAITTTDGLLSLLNTSTMKKNIEVDIKQYIIDCKVNQVNISKDLKKIVVCSGPNVFVFDAETLELYSRFINISSITSIQFQYQDEHTQILTGSEDGKIRKYTLGGFLLDTQSRHFGSITTLSINTNLMVAGSDDSTASLWDLKSRKQINHFTIDNMQRSAITSVALSRQNTFCILGNDRGIFSIYDVETGKMLKIISGHDQPITSVAISTLNFEK